MALNTTVAMSLCGCCYGDASFQSSEIKLIYRSASIKLNLYRHHIVADMKLQCPGPVLEVRNPH